MTSTWLLMGALNSKPERMKTQKKYFKKKKKKKKRQKPKGCLRKRKGIAITYHEEEHRVSNSASHSEQSCRNSYAQRPPLLEALWVSEFESEWVWKRWAFFFFFFLVWIIELGPESLLYLCLLYDKLKLPNVNHICE